MFIKITSTRDTAVGTFIHGIIYDVNMKNFATKKAVDVMLASGAAKKLTQKQLEKERESVVSIVSDDGFGAEVPVDITADEKSISEALGEHDAALKEVEALKVKLESGASVGAKSGSAK